MGPGPRRRIGLVPLLALDALAAAIVAVGATACVRQTPAQSGVPRPADRPAATATTHAAPRFVDVTTVAPHVRLEMRYAAADNFLHAAVYPACARCLLREDAAKGIAKAQAALEAEGYGLKLWDCYRPPAVQVAMWKIEPDARFVANPATGSVHNRGGAVDVTLVTRDGGALEMPTKHDDFTSAAYLDAPASPAATKNRAILHEALEGAGFTPIKTEWWHFDYEGSRGWPIEDVSLCP